MVASSIAHHLASNFDRGRARCWLSSDALENSWKLGGAVGFLSLVLRTVISRGRDEYGAVEKTLKGYSHHLHSACVPCGRGVVVHHLQ